MYLEDTDYECPYCQGQIFDSTEGKRACIHCQRVFDIDKEEAKKTKTPDFSSIDLRTINKIKKATTASKPVVKSKNSTKK